MIRFASAPAPGRQPRAQPSNSRVTSRPGARVPRDQQYRVVARDRPHDLRQLGPIDGQRQRLRSAGIGPQHQQLLHLIDAPQVLPHRAPDRRLGAGPAPAFVDSVRSYAPSAARLTSCSSLMSREMVACVA